MVKISADSVYLKVSCTGESINMDRAKKLIQKSIRVGTQNNLRGVTIILNHSSIIKKDAKALTLRVLDKFNCPVVVRGL